MIEVEKKFQPNEEELKALLNDAQFFDEKGVVDVYYDTPSFKFARANIFLRKRNNIYELKVYQKIGGKINTDQALEIVDEKEILNTLGYKDISFDEFIKGLTILGQIEQNRRKYIKNGFTIYVDRTGFGYNIIEIELMVSDSEREIAEKKILDFAKKYDLQQKDLLLKPVEYLRRVRPQIYKDIYVKAEK